MNYDAAIARAFIEANVKAAAELKKRQDNYESVDEMEVQKLVIEYTIMNIKQTMSDMFDEFHLAMKVKYDNVPKAVDKFLVREVYKMGVMEAISAFADTLKEGCSTITPAQRDLLKKQFNFDEGEES